MISANTLLNKTSSNVVPNTPLQKRNPLYNPDVPIINDENLKTNIKDLRSMRLKDRYYADMVVGRAVKNGDGFTLGPNNCGFNFFNNYDGSIDPNLIARRNPKNKQYTQPNNEYEGSFGAYYMLPKTTPRPQPIVPDLTNLLDSLNPYQYKNSNMPGALPLLLGANTLQQLGANNTQQTDTVQPSNLLSLPAPIDPTPSRFDMSKFGTGNKPVTKTDLNASYIENTRKMNDFNTIGFDPTTDPAYLKYQDELNKSKLQNEAYKQERQKMTDTYNYYGVDTETDANGLPVIKTPMKIGISDIGTKPIKI